MSTALLQGASVRSESETAPQWQLQGREFSPVKQHAPGPHPSHPADRKPVSSAKVAEQTPSRGTSPRGPAVIIARKRRAEITAILRDVCGGPCITDDATVWLDEVLVHVHLATSPETFAFALAEWTRLHTPRLTPADIEDACRRILPAPPRYSSADIGARLGLSVERYHRLGLTHVLPAGWTAKKRATRARKRKAAALKAKRHATGVTKAPRELSVAKLAPWMSVGKSEAWFYRLPVAERGALVAQVRGIAR